MAGPSLMQYHALPFKALYLDQYMEQSLKLYSWYSVLQLQDISLTYTAPTNRDVPRPNSSAVKGENSLNESYDL